MSVCLDTGNVLANQVSTSTAPQSPNDSTASSTSSSTSLVTVTNTSITTEQQQQSVVQSTTITQPVRTVTAKIPTAANTAATLSKASLITVLNTPLGNVKTLCVTPAVSSNASGQFTVVNSAAPLNVSTSAVVKSQTITLINTPVTVVKTISPNIEKSGIENVTNNNNYNNNNNNSNNNLSVVSGPNNNNNNNNTNNNNVSITSVPPLIENRGHNVFVKNTSCNGTDIVHSNNGQENIPQSHKILTANNFPTNNVLTATTLNTVDTQKTANGQRNKVKILSNILMPGTSQNSNNILLNKNASNSASISSTSFPSVSSTGISTTASTAINTTTTTSRFIPRQKLFNTNNNNNTTTTKYLNKPSMNITNKSNINPLMKTTTVGVGSMAVTTTAAPLQKIVYPAHKSQIKTIPPVNNYVQQQQTNKTHGIKTLPPKNITSTQIQRTGTGLRTIPPQNRPQKLPNKPNYIGKHAIQAHKLKQPNKLKTISKSNQIYNNYNSTSTTTIQQQQQQQQQEKPQMTFTQALTAEILETLGNKSSSVNNCYITNKNYDIATTRLENNYSQEIKTPYQNECFKSCSIQDDRNKSGLDALSLICQAVLLDHNYNATLPPDSPTRTVPSSTPSPMNGISMMFSPNSGKRRTLSSSSQIPSTNLSSISNSNNQIDVQDDDAASDISDVSDRKQDTEGEETDTAPEAEAVNNEDQFGDYVTRCICGFVHDDGYMVECDRCKVWQHVQCVVKNKQIPDEYLCEVCDPLKHIDRHKARMVQQQWLKDRQLIDPKLRKETKLKESFKHKDIVTDSDTSDGEHTSTNNNNNNNNILTKGRSNLMNRRKTDNQKANNAARQRREAIKDATHRRQVKKRERKAVRRKTRVQIKCHSDDDNQDVTSTHLPQLRQWIDNYEEAVTNHYSPELRARISSIRVNGVHNDVQVEYDTTVNKCRIHTQPLTEIKYLVSTVNLPPNTPVIELRGKYMLSTQQIKSGNNCNTRQHSQRPGPFLFFYRLHKDNTEVCVDTRTYGNSARFIRRSCKPNAELRHSIVKGVLHLYIVTIANVDKNVELTIKHESHDLAAIGTTHIACACGNLEECTVNKTTIKKNGDSTEMHRKRRGRRTVSVSASVDDTPIKYKTKEITTLSSPPLATTTIKEEIKVETKDVKEENDDIDDVKIKNEEPELEDKPIKEVIKTEDEANTTSDSSSAPPRRSSCHQKNDKEDTRETDSKDDNKNKKLSREERKLEAILRAIAQMEKADQRKQEHQAKQAHRRESEPSLTKDDDKHEPKIRRKRRKGRSRASSTNTQSTSSSRRNRLNSTDSYMTSGDETLLSPNEHHHHHHRSNISRNSFDYKENDTIDHHHSSSNQDAGLLLALSNSGSDGKIVNNNNNNNNKSPTREVDSNSNSAQSSPETHLSSACLLVQAAVEPMEAGFKFPKTKKGLMNEWLNKVPDTIQSASSISPSSLTPHINTSSSSSPSTSSTTTITTTTTVDYDSGFYTTTGKSLGTLAQVASFCDNNLQPRDSAKKRWLRQAISEDQCDSPLGRPESPPLNDAVAPPKKRRLPRESLSNETTPPSTPTNQLPSNNNDQSISQDVCVDVYNGADDDGVPQAIEHEVSIEETVGETKSQQQQQQFPIQEQQQFPIQEQHRSEVAVNLMDPRLSRDHRHNIFTNSEHLVGTVEKTLSILGFEDRKPESITPTKRKLSITEYRQRKKMTKNDKIKNEENDNETISNEENNSLESFKPPRLRSNSTSSSSRTSETSSDDEMASPLELPGKAPSAFNSEPTELERQREMTSLRLKKAFGISVDEEKRKPALDVDAILSCEIPSVVKTIPPSPNFPIPGSCDVNLSTSVTSSTELSTSRPVSPIINRKSPEQLDEQQQFQQLQPEHEQQEQQEQEHEQKDQDDQTKICEINGKIMEDTSDLKPNLYYTPDEEEEDDDEEEEEEAEEQVINDNPHGEYDEMDTIDYVPPFNNPIYPNDNSFTTYSSVIDEDGRYEGRNPSPPPDLDSSNSGTFSIHQT